ncbi:MAG: hypothetical protein ACI9R3_006413 [Verrucomicrobiales bacterium]|jgi:hypothetical protein
MARLNESLQSRDLSARIRSDKTVIPMGISLRTDAIYYKFREPDEIIELKIQRMGVVLNREVRTGKEPIPEADYGKPFRGTDMSIEDLSMRFLYWPNPVCLKDEQIGNAQKNCWVLQILNPDRTGMYQRVHVWVHKDTETLIQAEGFGWESSTKPIRRFEVTQLMRVDGSWNLKNMVIESLDPTTGRRLGVTTFQVRSPTNSKPAES